MLSIPLFARNGDIFPLIVVMVVLVLMVMFSFTLLVLKYYKRCPSNRVLVIFGKTESGEAATCVHGGARFVQPLIQDYAWLSLEPFRVEISERPVLAGQKIGVRVPQFFSVAIGTTPELMQNAAIRLLGLPFDAIEQQAADIIVGHLDRLIDSLEAGRVETDQEGFLDILRDSIKPELRQLGLILITSRYE